MLYLLSIHIKHLNPTTNPVGSIWCFCKKKLPPKAILLHFLYYLYEYSCTASLCMWVHLKSQVEEVVVVKSEYEQKISAIWLYLIVCLLHVSENRFEKYLNTQMKFSDINLDLMLWICTEYKIESYCLYKTLTPFCYTS